MTIKNKPMKLAMFALAFLVAAGTGYPADAAKKMSKMIPAKDIKWMKIEGTPAEIAVIWGDPSKGANGRMFKIPNGFSFPSHKHTGDYHAVLISGTWIHGPEGKTVNLPAGSYVFQMGGEFHTDGCASKEPCIIYSTQSVASDMIPKEMPQKKAAKSKKK